MTRRRQSSIVLAAIASNVVVYGVLALTVGAYLYWTGTR